MITIASFIIRMVHCRHTHTHTTPTDVKNTYHYACGILMFQDSICCVALLLRKTGQRDLLKICCELLSLVSFQYKKKKQLRNRKESNENFNLTIINFYYELNQKLHGFLYVFFSLIIDDKCDNQNQKKKCKYTIS